MLSCFALNDVVWCRNQKNDFIPGKIVLDESSKDWQKDDLVFVQTYSVGPGRKPKGKWSDLTELVRFDVRKGDTFKFESPSIDKVFQLARQEFLSGNNGAPIIKLERCREEWKSPVVKTKRGRPSRSSKGTGAKSSTKRSKVLTQILQDSAPKGQLNFEDDDDNEEEDGFDDETQAKIAADNKNFLDDLDDDDDDDNKENDREWSPGSEDKENVKPKSKLFVAKGRKPFTPIRPVKEEVSEYEKLQEKRREEQRQMLMSMKLASFELKKTFTPPVNGSRKIGGSAKGPAHRRRESAPVRYSTRKQPPRTRSRMNSDGTSDATASPTRKRPLFDDEDYDDDNYDGNDTN